MGFFDRFRGKKIKFDRDENGMRPPPVYLKPSTGRWKSKLGIDEEAAARANIAKARNNIDLAVWNLGRNDIGPESKKVIDNFLKDHPRINSDSLKEYSMSVADKMYSGKINISVTDQMYRSGKERQKYQQAYHRRSVGRVQFNSEPNVLKMEMTRSAISSADGAHHILGTIASSVPHNGSMISSLDFTKFVNDLNAAYGRDAAQAMKSLEKTTPHHSSDSSLSSPSLSGNTLSDAVTTAQTDKTALGTEKETSVKKTENLSDISRLSGDVVPLHKSETTEAIHALINGDKPSGLEAHPGADYDLEQWQEKKMEQAHTVKDLDALDKIMEDHKEVENQLGKLMDGRKEYSKENLKAITDALLKDMDDVQHRALHRGLQTRSKSHGISR